MTNHKGPDKRFDRPPAPTPTRPALVDDQVRTLLATIGQLERAERWQDARDLAVTEFGGIAHALLQVRADAAAAQALMVERAAEMAKAYCDKRFTGSMPINPPPPALFTWDDGNKLAKAIRSLAPDAGVAELAKLQAERDAGWTEAKYQEAERDTLTASLAAQTELVGMLTGAVKAAVDYMAFGATDTCQPYPLERCRAALEAAEIATMTPEQQALFKHSMAVRDVAKGIADGQNSRWALNEDLITISKTQSLSEAQQIAFKLLAAMEPKP